MSDPRTAMATSPMTRATHRAGMRPPRGLHAQKARVGAACAGDKLQPPRRQSATWVACARSAPPCHPGQPLGRRAAPACLILDAARWTAEGVAGDVVCVCATAMCVDARPGPGGDPAHLSAPWGCAIGRAGAACPEGEGTRHAQACRWLHTVCPQAFPCLHALMVRAEAFVRLVRHSAKTAVAIIAWCKTV
jgi:hypothetical protein